MCHQRADSSFLYKKALLATLRRRALTPSKMVPREGQNKLVKKECCYLQKYFQLSPLKCAACDIMNILITVSLVGGDFVEKYN